MNPDDYPIGEYPALPTGFFIDPYPEWLPRMLLGVHASPIGIQVGSEYWNRPAWRPFA